MRVHSLAAVKGNSGRLGAAVTWAFGATAVLSVCLLPNSHLPLLAVAGFSIVVLALTMPRSLLVRAIPVAIGVIPALTLLVTTADIGSAPGLRGQPGYAVAALMILLATIVVYRERPVLAIGLPEGAILLLAFALVIGSVHGEGPGLASSISRALVPFFLAWMLGRALTRSTRDASWLWLCGVAFVLINAPLGILEGITSTDLVGFPNTDLTDIGSTGFARPNGFQSTDIDFGLSMVLALALVLGGPPAPDRSRWVAPVALLGSAALMLASFRTGWIALAALWALWLFRRGPRFWSLLLIAGSAAVVITFGLAELMTQSGFIQERITNLENLEGRWVVLGQAWEVFLAHPAIGVGLNGFQVEPLVISSGNSTRTPHNLWLGVLAEFGLLGGIALATAAATTAVSAFRVIRCAPVRIGSRGAIWAGAVILVFSLLFYVLTVPISAMLFGLAVGSIRGLDILEAERPLWRPKRRHD